MSLTNNPCKLGTSLVTMSQSTRRMSSIRTQTRYEFNGKIATGGFYSGKVCKYILTVEYFDSMVQNASVYRFCIIVEVAPTIKAVHLATFGWSTTLPAVLTNSRFWLPVEPAAGGTGRLGSINGIPQWVSLRKLHDIVGQKVSLVFDFRNIIR